MDNKNLKIPSMEKLENVLRAVFQVDSETFSQMNQLLSSTGFELENCKNILLEPSELLAKRNPLKSIDQLPPSPTVATQGVEGAYQQAACLSVFEKPQISFYPNFEDVPKAVAAGDVEFGLLPIENSSAGEVNNVVEFICESNCYINTIVQIKIDHCLAGIKGSKLEDITTAYSHIQALRQSAGYLKSRKITPIETLNTAGAAKELSRSGGLHEACICSELSARLYNLEILQKGIQDSQENYTRFVCFSREALVLPEAEIISVALSFPNQPSALNKLLTRFSVFNLDLTKIHSMPIGGADFHVRFHLDFKGKISDPQVENLLGHMYQTYDDFQFLGNYQNC